MNEENGTSREDPGSEDAQHGGAHPEADLDGPEATAGTRHLGGPLAGHPSSLTPELPRWRRRRWLALAAVIGIVGPLTALFGFGLSRDPTAISSPLVNRPAPSFSLRTLDGSRIIRLSDLRGRVVIVNFWASWCTACREEHPFLLAAWERYRDHGVVIVGIDYQDSKRAAMQFMQQLGGDWPVVQDSGSQTALAYGVYGISETFFVDPHGVIRYQQIGPVTYPLLTDEITRLLPGR